MKPDSRSAWPADRIIGGLAEAAARTVTAVGCPQHATDASAIVSSVAAGAIGQFFDHVHWPGRLTASGFPVECSVAIAPHAAPAFRYLLDLSDHRLPLGENVPQLMAQAARIVPSSVPALQPLFAENLAGSDENSRTPVNHGCGYAADGRRRASLYFFVAGSRAKPFRERFPETAALVEQSLADAGGVAPSRVHSVSYDFDQEGRQVRQKFYGWLHVADLGDVRAAIGHHPDLRIADEFLAIMMSLGRIRITDAALLLQSSRRIGVAGCEHKIYANLQGWDIDFRELLLRSMLFGVSRLSLDVGPLESLFEAFQNSGLRLHPSWIAIGPGAAMTWYLVPEVVAAAPSAVELTAIRDRAIDHLLQRRGPDGAWLDQSGRTDIDITARVVSALAHVPAVRPALMPAAVWLRERMTSAADPDSLLWAVSALRALDPRATPAAAIKNVGTSAGALARAIALAGANGLEGSSAPLVDRLLARERVAGGWSDDDDVLTGTADVVGALIHEGTDGHLDPALMAALSRAAFVFADHPVVADPACAARWLKGWVECGLDPDAPSVHRALAYLGASQQVDGSWTSERRRADGGVDGNDVMTTTIVADALCAVCAAPDQG